ncbi:hypothetical protein [Geoalkalibacter subterraneus]|nr:hypothetical protein [Geoalkalibacter subterraneus]
MKEYIMAAITLAVIAAAMAGTYYSPQGELGARVTTVLTASK